MGIFFNSFKRKLLSLENSIDFDSDTIKVALLTSSFTPNIDTMAFFSDITNEVSGTGYTAGGATLSGQTTSQDNTDDEGVFDANDVTWTTATITARYAVLYKSTGTASTSPLIQYIDFGADKVSSGGDFTISWNAQGVFTVKQGS